jgi:antitoxin component of MazEF toxin-antitoxin module
MDQNHTEIVSDTTRLRKTGNSLALVVPKCICEALHWHLGELLLLQVVENTIRVEPVHGRLLDKNEQNGTTNNAEE